MQIILTYIAGFITVGVLDYSWLAHVAKDFYLKSLASHVSVKDGSLVVNLYGAIGFYILAVWSAYYFVVAQSSSLKESAIRGAIFGATAYGFYDLTNYATLRDWPLSITLLDIAWGAVILSATSAVMYFVYHRF